MFANIRIINRICEKKKIATCATFANDYSKCLVVILVQVQCFDVCPTGLHNCWINVQYPKYTILYLPYYAIRELQIVLVCRRLRKNNRVQILFVFFYWKFRPSESVACRPISDQQRAKICSFASIPTQTLV